MRIFTTAASLVLVVIFGCQKKSDPPPPPDSRAPLCHGKYCPIRAETPPVNPIFAAPGDEHLPVK